MAGGLLMRWNSVVPGRALTIMKGLLLVCLLTTVGHRCCSSSFNVFENERWSRGGG
jgi:hypothetical protein